MPVTKSAKKALRVSKRRKDENERVQKNFRAAIKSFRANPTAVGLTKTYSAIDRAAKNHVIHKNKSARLKSGLTKLVKIKPVVKKDKPAKKTAKPKSPRLKK